ncbi:gamma-glutamylcyclotransferase [Metabacillus niabensis]|uniref:gamma-glutamylcyclotransferase family protein n=1 Tax=Metabacillus niabensis TaxID=324854 RepID=UPI0039A10E7B
MEPIRVFVYGTLMEGESNHRVAKPYLLEVEEGSVSGNLYNVGPYPALTLSEDGDIVKGQWFNVTEEGLENMDKLEGFYGEGAPHNHYNREFVKDINNSIEGFVYTYTKEKVEKRGLPKIKSGSWKLKNK